MTSTHIEGRGSSEHDAVYLFDPESVLNALGDEPIDTAISLIISAMKIYGPGEVRFSLLLDWLKTTYEWEFYKMRVKNAPLQLSPYGKLRKRINELSRNGVLTRKHDVVQYPESTLYVAKHRLINMENGEAKYGAYLGANASIVQELIKYLSSNQQTDNFDELLISLCGDECELETYRRMGSALNRPIVGMPRIEFLRRAKIASHPQYGQDDNKKTEQASPPKKSVTTGERIDELTNSLRRRLRSPEAQARDNFKQVIKELTTRVEPITLRQWQVIEKILLQINSGSFEWQPTVELLYDALNKGQLADRLCNGFGLFRSARDLTQSGIIPSTFNGTLLTPGRVAHIASNIKNKDGLPIFPVTDSKEYQLLYFVAKASGVGTQIISVVAPRKDIFEKPNDPKSMRDSLRRERYRRLMAGIVSTFEDISEHNPDEPFAKYHPLQTMRIA